MHSNSEYTLTLNGHAVRHSHSVHLVLLIVLLQKFYSVLVPEWLIGMPKLGVFNIRLIPLLTPLDWSKNLALMYVSIDSIAAPTRPETREIVRNARCRHDTQCADHCCDLERIVRGPAFSEKMRLVWNMHHYCSRKGSRTRHQPYQAADVRVAKGNDCEDGLPYHGDGGLSRGHQGGFCRSESITRNDQGVEVGDLCVRDGLSYYEDHEYIVLGGRKGFRGHERH